MKDSAYQRPNVLILYTDQQRFDSLGCNGNPFAHTPNLDRMASQGARLGNFFIQNPVCMPSRMSFLTGRYPSSLGVGCNGIPFPPNAITLNQYLKPYGYHTAQIGKLHFIPHAGTTGREPYPDFGFDTAIISDNTSGKDNPYMKWVEMVAPDQFQAVRRSIDRTTSPLYQKLIGMCESDQQKQEIESWFERSYWFHNIFEGDEHLTHNGFVAAETVNFLKQNHQQPFFLISGFFGPHAPFNPPKRFLDLFDVEDMPLPRLAPHEQWNPLFLNKLSSSDWQEIVAYYYALVAHIDDCIGQILRTLDNQGLSENTLVIFVSDHGEYLGDHGLTGKGMPGYDCITRVPSLLLLPGWIQQGMVVDDLIEALDILPTILDYCGVQSPSAVQGRSIRPLLEGRETNPRQDVLTEHFTPDGFNQTTLRTHTHKYSCDSLGREYLFDLDRDPLEFENLSGSEGHQRALSELRKRTLLRVQGSAYNSRPRVATF